MGFELMTSAHYSSSISYEWKQACSTPAQSPHNYSRLTEGLPLVIAAHREQ